MNGNGKYDPKRAWNKAMIDLALRALEAPGGETLKRRIQERQAVLERHGSEEAVLIAVATSPTGCRPQAEEAYAAMSDQVRAEHVIACSKYALRLAFEAAEQVAEHLMQFYPEKTRPLDLTLVDPDVVALVAGLPVIAEKVARDVARETGREWEE